MHFVIESTSTKIPVRTAHYSKSNPSLRLIGCCQTERLFPTKKKLANATSTKSVLLGSHWHRDLPVVQGEKELLTAVCLFRSARNGRSTQHKLVLNSGQPSRVLIFNMWWATVVTARDALQARPCVAVPSRLQRSRSGGFSGISVALWNQNKSYVQNQGDGSAAAGWSFPRFMNRRPTGFSPETNVPEQACCLCFIAFWPKNPFLSLAFRHKPANLKSESSFVSLCGKRRRSCRKPHHHNQVLAAKESPFTSTFEFNQQQWSDQST